MKKSLIALAALAAVSAASAQSTVTISGALVLGVGTTELGTVDSGAQIVRQTGNIQFAGSEDLGGGLKAGFAVQTAIGAAATTNQTTSSITNQRTLLGDRAANLTLTGGFGGIVVGLANTSVKTQMGIADVTGLPIVSGLSKSSSGASATSAGNVEIAAGDANAGIIYGDTYSQQVAYQSPSISGFNISVGAAPAQNTLTGAGDNTNTKDTASYTLNYSNGPLNASANITDARGSSYTLTTLVANYDFGVAKIGVATQSVRLDSGTNPGNGTMITANIPMGPGAFGLGYGRRSATDSTSTSFGDNVKQKVIGYKYPLSKRTSISAVYNDINRSATATSLTETHILIGHSF